MAGKGKCAKCRASHKNFNFFCAWAENKNIEAQACVLADG